MRAVDARQLDAIPQAWRAIERQRLLAKFQSSKLTLVVAPSGYGKTVLVAQFAHLHPSNTAWCTLESEHRDVAALFHAVVLAIRQCVSDVDSLLATSRHRSGELAGVIADCLDKQAASDANFVLVLDNIHILSGIKETRSFVWTMIKRLPTNWHLVLVGRKLPDLPLADVVDRDQSLITEDDLRFIGEEVQELSAKIGGERINREEADCLAQALNGWPFGLGLALQQATAINCSEVRDGNIGTTDLVKKLGVGTLNTLPADLRLFLLKSSTLSRLTVEYCGEILGLLDSDHWLSQIEQSQFVLKIGDNLVYHSLFRFLLQYQFRSQHPTEYDELHLKAAQWFERAGNLDESFEHYMAASSVKEATAFADRFADMLYAQGFSGMLMKWRAQLGEHSAMAPRLKYNCARIHSSSYEYELAEIELDNAETKFREGADEASLADIQIHRAIIRIQSGQFRQAITCVAPLLGMAKHLDHKRPGVHRVLGCAYLRLGEIDIATFYLETALKMHEATEDGQRSVHTIANILHDLATAYLRQGRITEASDNLYQAVELRRELNCPRELARALKNLGEFYHYAGDYRQAVITFREALALLSGVADRRIRAGVLWRFGNLRRDQGQFEEAQRYYGDALELVGDCEPAISCGIQISMSVLKCWTGDMPMAANLAQAAFEVATTHEIAANQARADAVRWAAHAGQGKTPEAYEALETIIEDLQRQSDQTHVIWCHGLRMVAALDFDPELAREEIEPIWKLMDAGVSIQPLIAEMAHNPRLEKFVLALGGSRESKLTQGLAVLRGERVEQPAEYPHIASEKQNQIELHITTLGQERIVLNGEVISMSRWKLSSPRQLFFYLLFTGPLGRDQICSVFWPEGDSRQVRDNFHTLIYRARQVFGAQAILHEPEGEVYLINPGTSLWCDALEFESLMQKTHSMSPGPQMEGIRQQAINLYHGDFLPSWEDDWVLVRRQALLSKYIDSLLGVGRNARERRSYEEALSTFQQVLAVAPYNEAAHRSIMQCYAELGENKQVIAQFDALSQLLADWDVTPSDQTRQLYLQLISAAASIH